MKKLFLSIALVIGLVSASSVAFSQEGRFSVGAELAIPMGDFGDAVGIGFGGSLRYEAPVGDNLGITGTAGYLSFSGKNGGESTYMIPVQAGLKYYFTEQQMGFYGHVMAGLHFYKSYEIDLVNFTIEETTTSAFSYAPEIGYHLDNIDFGLRYQFVSTEGSTTSYLGLRVAYVFGSN